MKSRPWKMTSAHRAGVFGRCFRQGLAGYTLRGSWSELEMDSDVLKFFTETAWSPCNETFDLVREAFPSLRYYFQAEEPGMCIYENK